MHKSSGTPKILDFAQETAASVPIGNSGFLRLGRSVAFVNIKEGRPAGMPRDALSKRELRLFERGAGKARRLGLPDLVRMMRRFAEDFEIA